MVIVALPQIMPKRRSPRLLVTSALAMLLAGCSSVPDVVNPVEWYKGTRDILIGEDSSTNAGQPLGPRRALPGTNQPIPNLSSVPQRPRTSSRAQRDAISRGLVADLEQSRRYTSEVIPRQGQAVDPLRSAVAQRSTVPARSAPTPASPPRQVVTASPPVQPMSQAATRPSLPPPAQPVPQVVARSSAPPPAPLLAARPTLPEARPAINPPGPPRAMASAPPPRLGTIHAPPISPITADPETIVVSSAGVRQLSGGMRIVAPVARPGARPSRPAPQSSKPTFKIGIGESYQVARILFGNGSSQLSARDRQILRQVAQQARQTGGVIRVVGHASHRTKALDPIKHKVVNLRVSVARADAVARQLVEFGTSSTNIVLGAASDTEPRYLEHMPTGEAGNRRADIFIDF